MSCKVQNAVEKSSLPVAVLHPFELPVIKIIGTTSRDYIAYTTHSTRSEPSYNDWKHRHYTKYNIH